jgi:CheY-like chemotaxis protein
MISRHTILYAEDDQDDVLIVTKAFEAHDHIKVIHAADGREAIQNLDKMVAENRKPCLIILDINMPVMSGKEALVKIKENERTNKIPVVLFSTSSSNIDKTFADKWGVELFTKPILYSDLNDIARMFVDKCNFEINNLNSN